MLGSWQHHSPSSRSRTFSLQQFLEKGRGSLANSRRRSGARLRSAEEELEKAFNTGRKLTEDPSNFCSTVKGASTRLQSQLISERNVSRMGS